MYVYCCRWKGYLSSFCFRQIGMRPESHKTKADNLSDIRPLIYIFTRFFFATYFERREQYLEEDFELYELERERFLDLLLDIQEDAELELSRLLRLLLYV